MQLIKWPVRIDFVLSRKFSYSSEIGRSRQGGSYQRLAVKRTLSLLLLLFTASCNALGDDKNIEGMPPLPQKEVLAASFFYHNEWYAMNQKEIAAVAKLLKGKPYVSPPGSHEILATTANKVVLWIVDGNKLASKDVVKVGYQANFIHSVEKRSWFNISEEEGRTALLDLIRRIDEGVEQPLFRHGQNDVPKK